MNEIILALPVFLPVLSGVVMLFHPWGRKEWDRKRELFIEGLVVLNSLLVAAAIGGGTDGGRRLVLFRLYSTLTIMFKLDSMGSVFAGLVAFLWPLATLYAFEYMKHEERKNTFFAFYTMTYGITMGIALAGNLVTLYLFYEMLTLVTLPLVLFPLTTEAVRAGRSYLYYSIGGAAFAFIGLVFVLGFSSVGTTEFMAGGMLDLERAMENRNTLLFVYVLAFFGFGVKAALFPCYRWLPKAAVAPTPCGGRGQVGRLRHPAAYLFQFRNTVFERDLGPVDGYGGSYGDHCLRFHHGSERGALETAAGLLYSQ